MVKEKATLTLNADNLAALRSLVGSRSLSAAVDAAIVERLARLRHLAAVDEWLAQLDAGYGRVPPETLEWAVRRRDLPVATVAAVLAEVVQGRPAAGGVFAGLRRERVEVRPVDVAVDLTQLATHAQRVVIAPLEP